MRNFTELYRMDLPHREISVYIFLTGRKAGLIYTEQRLLLRINWIGKNDCLE